jgi:prepilin-type N-terminal cleavage/methylation domain-containing protein
VPVPRCVERRYGTTRRPGFTLIELIIVIMIGAVLVTIAVPQFGRQASKRSAMNARDAFITAAARARSAAIQSGDEVTLRVNPATNRVEIIDRFENPVADPLDFQTGPVKARILGNFIVTVRYTPRGFAHPASVPGTDVIFTSVQGRDSARARITIGQVDRL